jgi:hypothetical protein
MLGANPPFRYIFIFPEEALMEVIPIVSVLCVFVAVPGIIFSFIYFSRKSKLRLEELKYKKEMLELEIEKEEAHIRLIEAENAKYDRLIADESKR